MKKSEKIITAVLTIVVGVLMIAMQDNFIGLLMTVAGVCLVVLGVVDIFCHALPPAVVKSVSGVLIIICGWTLLEAVLYIAAALLLTAGILLLYDKLKKKVRGHNLLFTLWEYVTPVVLIFIGSLFLLHQVLDIQFVLIIGGICSIAEGGVLLINAFQEE